MKNIKTKNKINEDLELIKNNIKELLEIEKKAHQNTNKKISYLNILKKTNQFDSCFKFVKKYSILSNL